MKEASPEVFWKGEATRLARRVNLGWWADRFNLAASILLLLGAVVILCVRSFGPGWLTESRLWIGAAIIFLIAVAVGVVRSRRHWIGKGESLVRLDSRLALRGRLVTADAGLASWPAPAAPQDLEAARPRWRWALVFLPVLAALSLCLVAVLVPLPRIGDPPSLAAAEPEAWQRMEEWLDTLAEEELIRPEVEESYEEKIEQLRSEDEEDWFQDSSLEATDTLESQLGLGIREMADSVAEMERDLERLRSSSPQANESREQALSELGRGLESLEMNELSQGSGMSEELQRMLSQEAGSGAGLSPEEMEALREQLASGSEALGSLEGLPEGGFPSRPGGEEQGPVPGQGTPDRGPGDAPLYFGDARETETGRLEAVKGRKRDDARIGDLVGTGEEEYPEEEGPEERTGGGEIGSLGTGGEKVWRETLLPDEQRVLKRFYGPPATGSGEAPSPER